MSDSLATASKGYGVFLNEHIIGFAAVLHFPHPTAKRIKRVHRLVIAPDYQGIGIGSRFLEEIGKLYYDSNYRLRITTSAKNLYNALKNRDCWLLDSYGRKSPHKGMTNQVGSSNRNTYSFEYKG